MRKTKNNKVFVISTVTINISLRYGFSCESSRYLSGRRFLYTRSRSKRDTTMCLLVSLQVPILSESLVTLWAGIRFFSGVYSHVNPQGTRLGEWFCTLGAGVRLHATMCPLVTLQVTRLSESLVTLGAGIRFLSGVYSNVLPQATWSREGFCTLGTGVGRHATMCPLMTL